MLSLGGLTTGEPYVPKPFESGLSSILKKGGSVADSSNVPGDVKASYYCPYCKKVSVVDGLPKKCPTCNHWVYPKADGTCPVCGAKFPAASRAGG